MTTKLINHDGDTATLKSVRITICHYVIKLWLFVLLFVLLFDHKK